MWQYRQSTGELISTDGEIVAIGYSGGGIDPHNLSNVNAKNNPLFQTIHDLGPIPIGGYTISPPVNTVTHGPYVMALTPDIDNDMYGRDEFKIHGDSVVRPGFASDGCIILAHDVRVRIWESGDHQLEVIS